MKSILRFLSSWPEFLLLAASVAVFFVSPLVLRFVDPTAGAFDGGYIQRPIVAVVYFYASIFAAWTAIDISFRTLSRWLHLGGFPIAWETFSDPQKIVFAVVVFTVLVADFLVCLALVPL